jgi:hypothetical protein
MVFRTKRGDAKMITKKIKFVKQLKDKLYKLHIKELHEYWQCNICPKCGESNNETLHNKNNEQYFKKHCLECDYLSGEYSKLSIKTD